MSDLLLRAAALAQDVPNVNPDPSMPGAGQIQELINWVGYAGLAVAVLSILLGGITWALARAGNNPKAQSGAGRVLMTGAILGAIVGLATFAVTVAFGFGGSVQ